VFIAQSFCVYSTKRKEVVLGVLFVTAVEKIVFGACMLSKHDEVKFRSKNY